MKNNRIIAGGVLKIQYLGGTWLLAWCDLGLKGCRLLTWNKKYIIFYELKNNLKRGAYFCFFVLRNKFLEVDQNFLYTLFKRFSFPYIQEKVYYCM